MNDLGEKSDSRKNLIAISFMISGMAATAVVDAVVKGASTLAAPSQIVAVVGFGTAALFAILILVRREAIFHVRIFHPAVISRTFSEIVGSFGMVLALSTVSLTLVTAVIQTVPILVTLGAVLIFKERASSSDWLALLGGLIGMLMIIRPGGAGFDPYSLIAVIAALGLAARDLSSRAVPVHTTTSQLGVIGGLALGLVGILFMYLSPEPMPPVTNSTLAFFAATIVFAAAGFFFVTSAMRTGKVSVVSPFRYTRLVFGVALGVVVFGERIDGMSAAGALLIVACGYYLLRRELR